MPALLWGAIAVAIISASPSANNQNAAAVTLPSGPLAFGVFTVRFDPGTPSAAAALGSGAGAFTLSGEGWPTMAGAWAIDGRAIASGRGPERPIFAVKPGARGDLTLAKDQTASAQVAWSKTGRGSYMPTPLFARGILYVLANNGVFDAYDPATGTEIYRQRLPLVGSGFSASPVSADGKIYLTNEDGEMLVVEAGPTFKLIATNSMGETVMATPALSQGVMFVRGAASVFAIGRR